MAAVRGVLVEHAGSEYLVTTDTKGLPDLRKRDANGTWVTLKKKGPSGKAGQTADDILKALGIKQPPGVGPHTQQSIKNLVIHCVQHVIGTFFVKSRW